MRKNGVSVFGQARVSAKGGGGSLPPVLLLLFLEKLEGHCDQFYPKPKFLGPHGQHPRFVVAELWADRDM